MPKPPIPTCLPAGDGNALHRAAVQAKENMNLKKEDAIDELSDKGYHTGAALQQCHDDNIQTYTAMSHIS
jgi:hypothetical protein